MNICLSRMMISAVLNSQLSNDGRRSDSETSLVTNSSLDTTLTYLICPTITNKRAQLSLGQARYGLYSE